MAARDPRFILGNGEVLTTDVSVTKGFGDKAHPYSFGEARANLGPLFSGASEQAQSLPKRACPGGNTVATLTLHPSYLAKSYFPTDFLRATGLDAVGSRSVEITPKQMPLSGGKNPGPVKPQKMVANQLYVAGEVSRFAELPERLASAREDSSFGEDLVKIEDFRVPGASERLREPRSADDEVLLEAVLHTGARHRMRQLVLAGFEEFLEDVDAEANFDLQFLTDGLCFVPVRSPRARVANVAEFSFLRIVREMPSLRQFRPFFRDVPGIESFAALLPDQPPVDDTVRVAVFDGGLPTGHGLGEWAVAKKAPGVGEAAPEFQRHGLAVTSALLLGPLGEDEVPDRPPVRVEHFRVLDTDTRTDPDGELYKVLERVEGILKKGEHEYVNLSIGPDLPVDDHHPSAWTTVLDRYFASGEVLATVAVGNRGDENPDTGYTRVQPPSDCVNAISVGSSDSQGGKWKRASYSCIGPGRCPGLVKPDVMAFGGSRKEPFWALDAGKPGHAAAITGTSFAAPNALRLGLKARAHFGETLTPLGIKALLVHGAEDRELPREEVGWGRVPPELEDLVMCGEHDVHVLYQGALTPRKWMRAEIPLPQKLIGMVELSVTICYATSVDPKDTVNYTRSGLEIVFRPNKSRREPGQAHAPTKPFFGKGTLGASEQVRRQDAHKWETTLHSSAKFQPRSLDRPVFDVHYIAREGGQDTRAAEEIPYAIVASIRAPKTPNLFDLTLRRYPVLQQLRPQVEIPLRARA